MNTGDKAPLFVLPDQDGNPHALADLLAKGPVVLFFYPAAMTSGCTAEACHFRDTAAEFAAVGAQRVGISVDAVEKQKAFADKHGFDFPLLSDVGGRVAEQFGVKRGLLGRLVPVRRKTFVIGTDGTVLATIANELKFDVHADKALEVLRAPR